MTVDFQTDGTGTSGLGTMDLGTSTIPVSITVNNYAQASIEDLNNVGTLQQNGNAYTLNLGTIAQGAVGPTIDLGVLNSAIGPADLLSGNFSISGDSVFTNSGFAAFSGLAAGGAGDTAPTISLATGTTGTFTETITLDPTGSNASGYSGALTPETLTVTGQVIAALTVAVTINRSVINVANDTGTVTFTFSEAPVDFSLADVASADGTLSNLSGSGTSYSATFTANAGVVDAAATVSVINGSYHDAGGNAGIGGSTTPFTVDTVTPTVAVAINNTDVNLAHNTGTVTFTFSEAPTAFILADTTATGGTLSNLSGSGTTYTATFTGATSTDVTNASVAVTAGSWQDSSGNPGAGGSTTPSRWTP